MKISSNSNDLIHLKYFKTRNFSFIEWKIVLNFFAMNKRVTIEYGMSEGVRGEWGKRTSSQQEFQRCHWDFLWHLIFLWIPSYIFISRNWLVENISKLASSRREYFLFLCVSSRDFLYVSSLRERFFFLFGLRAIP